MAKVGEDYSYLLVRPHAVLEQLDVPISDFIEQQLKDVQVLVSTSYGVWQEKYQTAVREEYAEHIDKPFYSDLVHSMTGEFHPHEMTAIVFVVYTKKRPTRPMWERVRELCGPTDPAEAPDTTIRGKFGKPGVPLRYNVVHTPDSLEAVKAFEKRFIVEGLRGSDVPPRYDY